MKDES
jgi:replication factor C subunit 2/4